MNLPYMFLRMMMMKMMKMTMMIKKMMKMMKMRVIIVPSFLFLRGVLRILNAPSLLPILYCTTLYYSIL